jgi:hypothetical protein
MVHSDGLDPARIVKLQGPGIPDRALQIVTRDRPGHALHPLMGFRRPCFRLDVPFSVLGA